MKYTKEKSRDVNTAYIDFTKAFVVPPCSLISCEVQLLIYDNGNIVNTFRWPAAQFTEYVNRIILSKPMTHHQVLWKSTFRYRIEYIEPPALTLSQNNSAQTVPNQNNSAQTVPNQNNSAQTVPNQNNSVHTVPNNSDFRKFDIWKFLENMSNMSQFHYISLQYPTIAAVLYFTCRPTDVYGNISLTSY
jgi:hypothetical protein